MSLAIKVASNKDFQNENRPINLPLPENLGDAANKQYVDAEIENLLGIMLGRQVPKPLDCSTNPNYPPANPGQPFLVTVAGKIGGPDGEVVGVDDTIYCLGIPDVNDPEDVTKNQPSPGGTEAEVGNQFWIKEGNRDQATTSTLGLVEIATQAEVDLGADTDRAVTPNTLKQRLLDFQSGSSFSSQIGNGSQNEFTINHNLATTNISIDIRETTSGIWVEAFKQIIDANNIKVGFTNNPPSNFYTVVVKK